MLRALPILALLACTPALKIERKFVGLSSYDLISPDRKNAVEWHGHTAIPGALEMMAEVQARGRELCETSEAKRQFDITWCAAVRFEDDPFVCENTPPPARYHGCQPYVFQCLFQVGWREKLVDTTLIDELAHYAFEICKGKTGETNSVGLPRYDVDFDAFVASIRASFQ